MKSRNVQVLLNGASRSCEKSVLPFRRIEEVLIKQRISNRPIQTEANQNAQGGPASGVRRIQQLYPRDRFS